MHQYPSHLSADDILASGVFYDIHWVVMANRKLGVRCGYVLVPAYHPWAELDLDTIPVNVHGGLTYSCPEGDSRWIGFDCAHAGDGWPDLGILSPDQRGYFPTPIKKPKTTNYVIAECRILIEQITQSYPWTSIRYQLHDYILKRKYKDSYP